MHKELSVKSRVRGDFHARFCERVRVKLPRSTRPMILRQFTMRDAVNDYLEACGANCPSIGGEETILAHRKIAANRLEIDCIYALSKEELFKVDRELEGIVGDVPRLNVGVRR